MPPRHHYWTIILEGKPTAFRAHTQEELIPTLRQLQARHPDAVGRGRRALHLGAEIRDVDLRAAMAERQRALDDVFELPDIARPRVRHQPAHCLL